MPVRGGDAPSSTCWRRRQAVVLIAAGVLVTGPGLLSTFLTRRPVGRARLMWCT